MPPSSRAPAVQQSGTELYNTEIKPRIIHLLKTLYTQQSFLNPHLFSHFWPATPTPRKVVQILDAALISPIDQLGATLSLIVDAESFVTCSDLELGLLLSKIWTQARGLLRALKAQEEVYGCINWIGLVKGVEAGVARSWLFPGHGTRSNVPVQSNDDFCADLARKMDRKYVEKMTKGQPVQPPQTKPVESVMEDEDEEWVEVDGIEHDFEVLDLNDIGVAADGVSEVAKKKPLAVVSEVSINSVGSPVGQGQTVSDKEFYYGLGKQKPPRTTIRASARRSSENFCGIV